MGEVHTRMTAVFECDLRKFKGNPFHQDTPFGRPVTTCIGDALDDPAREAAEDLVEALGRLVAEIDAGTVTGDAIRDARALLARAKGGAA